MASQAYDKALQLDKGNQAAQTKLNLIRDLFTGGTRPPKVAMAQTVPKTVPPPAARPITPAPAVPAAAQAVAPNPAPVAAVKEPAKEPVKEPAPAKAAPPANNPEAVLKAVDNWATAWSGNDVDGYLARYAPGFKTPDGEPRKTWESERRARIAKPRKIEVRVEAPKVTFSDTNRATVTFRQHYRSNNLKVSASKKLEMVRSGNQWLIQEELVGG